MSITEISIKRPLFITVVFVTLILLGFLSYKNLNYELLPKFEFNILSISTSYSGASPEEVLTSVTKPIEDAVQSLEGLDKVTSSSNDGMSFITVTLKAGADVKTAQTDAERKISQIKASLPENADDPIISRFSTADLPVLQFSITSKEMGTELYDFIDQSLSPQLSAIEGVAQVKITGGDKRVINVSIDNDRMSAYGLTPSDINIAVSMSGIAFPAGAVNNNAMRFSIDLDAKVKSVEELRNVVVRQNEDGSRVLLRDVSYVSDGQAESTVLNRINGNSGIGVQVYKQTDANAVNVSSLVHEKLNELKSTYKDVDFDYHIASDSSIYTLASADAAMVDLMLAIVIVGAIMLFFLHSLRSASFVLVAIPAAIIPTFIAMYVMDFSLNLMTLMGLSLVVGVLVDDSIVVLENIYRHLEMGKNKATAAIEGRKEISITAVGITLVDVVVFLPISLSGGLLGGILREYSLVIVFSTLMSLLVAFTLTPMLAARWGRLSVFDKNTLWGKLSSRFEAVLGRIKAVYATALSWSLSHKRYIFAGVISLFIATIALIPGGFIGTDFFPSSDRGEVNIQVDLSSQSSLKQTVQTVAKIESIILAHREVENVFSNVGTQAGADGGSSENSNLAELSVTLKDRSVRDISTADFIQKIRNELESIPGVKPTFRMVGMVGNADFDLQMSVRGTDLDSVMKAANLVSRVMSTTPGSDYTQFSTKNPKQTIHISMNREKMAKLGVSVSELGNSIQYSFRGNDNTKFFDMGEDYKVNLVLDNADRSGIDNIRNLNVINNRGVSVPLEEIATITVKQAPAAIQRINRMNAITVQATASGRPAGTIMDEIKARVDQEKLPVGVTYAMEGNNANQDDAFGNLGIAIVIAIILMYLVMVALYESVIDPFIVLLALPMALIGALLALALTLNSLNIFSILGIILLFGLVAKNGILLVDFANQQQAKGLSIKEALLEAGAERIRPILMTTLAMVFGMLPMALASGAGSESKNAMAWVIIGGLLTSMIFTLVLVPSVYMVVANLKLKYQNRTGKNKSTASVIE